MKSHAGSVVTTKCMSEIMTTKRCEKVESEGKVVLRDKAVTPSKAAVQRYQAGTALMDTTAVVKHAIPKTPTRYIAENSM